MRPPADPRNGRGTKGGGLVASGDGRGSAIFAPEDLSSSYVASMSSADTQWTAGSNGGVLLRKNIATFPRDTAPISSPGSSQSISKPSAAR